MKTFITLIALIISFNASAKGMHKCVTNGKISYQNSHCSDRMKLPVIKSTKKSFSKSYNQRTKTVDLTHRAASIDAQKKVIRNQVQSFLSY